MHHTSSSLKPVVSGRSSAYGDVIHETTGNMRPESVTSSSGIPSTTMGHADPGEMIDESETDVDSGQRMHTLRLMLLEKLLQYMPELREVGGVRAIPFMQVGMRGRGYSIYAGRYKGSGLFHLCR